VNKLLDNLVEEGNAACLHYALQKEFREMFGLNAQTVLTLAIKNFKKIGRSCCRGRSRRFKRRNNDRIRTKNELLDILV
jgi:thymidine kinase